MSEFMLEPFCIGTICVQDLIVCDSAKRMHTTCMWIHLKFQIIRKPFIYGMTIWGGRNLESFMAKQHEACYARGTDRDGDDHGIYGSSAHFETESWEVPGFRTTD